MSKTELLNVNQVCTRLGLDLEAVYKLIHLNQLDASMVGKQWVVVGKSVDEYRVKQGKQALQMVGTKEMGRRIGVSHTRVAQLINEGKIQAEKINGSWKISDDEAKRVEEWWPLYKQEARERQIKLANRANKARVKKMAQTKQDREMAHQFSEPRLTRAPSYVTTDEATVKQIASGVSAIYLELITLNRLIAALVERI